MSDLSMHEDVLDPKTPNFIGSILSLSLSLDGDQTFKQGTLDLTRTHLLIKFEDQDARSYPLDPEATFKVVHFVGAGMLIKRLGDKEEILAYFPKEDYPSFKYLEKVLADRHLLPLTSAIPEDLIPTPPRCELCGHKIPEKAGFCPHCVKKSTAIKKIAEIAKAQTGLYLTALVIFVLFTGAKILPPIFYRRMIDRHIEPQTGSLKDILILVAIVAGLELAVQGLMIIRRILMAKAASNLVRDLRDMVYEKLQSFSLSYIHKYKTGDLMNRITGDTQVIRDFIQQIGADALNEMLVLIVVTLLLFVMNWRLALLIYVPVPLMYLMIEKFRTHIHRDYRLQGRQWDRANSVLQELIHGIRVIKAFGLESKSIDLFDKESRAFADISIKNEKKWNTLFPLAYFVLMLGNLLLLYVGGTMILKETMTLGELIMFTQYATMLYQPLNWLGYFPRMLTRTAVSIERIFSIITHDPDILDRSEPVHIDLKGHIGFDQVSFGYKSHEPVINDVSFDIRPGEMVGLVGHSGAGKSTIINLLMRLYDTDEGIITLDGIPIRDIGLSDLHRQIGVVLQETFLFNGSVYDNIRYTKPHASREEIIRAAKIANIHDFIVSMPDGYDTYVGERGQRLSGGEKQRIAIARAILADPKILILDEATASLDTHSEGLIHDALERLIKNRTTIAIAHRLSTLKNADRLIVFEKGRTIEIGSHKELMDHKGTYYKLVKAQLSMNRLQGDPLKP